MTNASEPNLLKRVANVVDWVRGMTTIWSAKFSTM